MRSDNSFVSPLEIDLVEYKPSGSSRLVVHVQGSWQSRTASQRRPVLVVEVNGRLRRFPAVHAPRRRSFDRRASWSARFVVPASLGPSLDGHMALGFADSDELIPLPALFEENTSTERGAEGRRTARGASRRERPALERRPVTEKGAMRRAARMREGSRGGNTTAALRRELQRLQRELRDLRAELRKERQEHAKYYRTANDLARHVANMYSQMSAAKKSEEETAAERDRLAADLESLRGELHAEGSSSPTAARLAERT